MKRPSFALLLCVLLGGACGTDAPPAPIGPPPSEHGRWGVLQASRNGQITHMIDVAYFEFDTAAQQLTTNFTGEETVFGYLRDESGISTDGSLYFDRMNFESITDTSLRVTAEVSGYFFRIDLVPQAQRIDRTQVQPVQSEPLQ